MNSFRLQNVKAFLDSGTVELRPITIIIGQNSSGKSSLLRFPLVLKQTFLDDSEAPLLFYGKSIDYGNYEDVVFGHDVERSMEFEVSIASADLLPYLPSQTFFNDIDEIHQKLRGIEKLTLHFDISFSGNKVRMGNLEIKVANESIFTVYEDETLDENTALKYGIDVGFGGFLIGSSAVYRDFHEKFLLNPFMLGVFNSKFTDNDDDVKLKRMTYDFYEPLFRAIFVYFYDLSKETNYIGPTRVSAERSYRFKENAVNYVGHEGEFAPVILAQDQRSGGTILANVSNWLSEHLNMTLDVDDSSDTFKLVVTNVSDVANNQDGPPVKNNLIDVGHGLSQLIPIIVQVFMDREQTSRNSRKFGRAMQLNLIEQPELHLHPAAQAALADLFIAGVHHSGEGEEPKRTYLIETHSEHMLLRLRRRIVEGTLNPDDVAIYYTEKNADGKSVDVRRLEIEPDGSIPEWPEGLFEEDYREVLELREAMRKKQKGGGPLPW